MGRRSEVMMMICRLLLPDTQSEECQIKVSVVVVTVVFVVVVEAAATAYVLLFLA